MRFDIITGFPGAFASYLDSSMMRRAIQKKSIQVKIHDLRDYTTDAHKTIDDRPYGGGPGMVLKIEPIFKCLKKIYSKKNSRTRVILFDAKGGQFDQKKALDLGKRFKRIIMVCGHYEGVDARVEKLVDEKISVGPYVLTGGELPALVIVDAVTRLLKGVLGNEASLDFESFLKGRDLKEYPQYTRPEIFEPKKGSKWRVPKVLISGDHKNIAKWRMKV